MGRGEREPGYIITAVFLCQALLSLNKKCLFALLRKHMGSVSVGSEELPPSARAHTLTLTHGQACQVSQHLKCRSTQGSGQSLVLPIAVQKSRGLGTMSAVGLCRVTVAPLYQEREEASGCDRDHWTMPPF